MREPVDVVVRRRPAERDADVAMGEDAHRREHVGRPQGARRTGRTAGDGEALRVQCGDQCLAVDVQTGEGEHVRQPVVRVADHLDIGDVRGDAAPEFVDPGPVLLVQLGRLGLARLQGGRRGERVRDVREPGGEAVLPLVHRPGRRRAASLPYGEQPDAGRSTPLVRTRGQRRPPGRYGVVPDRRGRVDEQRYVATGLGRGLDRLPGPDLVVGRLQRRHRDAWLRHRRR